MRIEYWHDSLKYIQLRKSSLCQTRGWQSEWKEKKIVNRVTGFFNGLLWLAVHLFVSSDHQADNCVSVAIPLLQLNHGIYQCRDSGEEKKEEGPFQERENKWRTLSFSFCLASFICTTLLLIFSTVGGHSQFQFRKRRKYCPNFSFPSKTV